MGRICEITGKKKLKGHRVSHANNKTNHFQQPNIQNRSVFIPETNAHFKIKVSTSGIKILNRAGGLSRYLAKADPETLNTRLRRLRKAILKKGLSPFG